MSSFTAADYVVCGTTLLISAGIGVYFALTGGRQRSQAEYLLAGRSAGAVPVAFSLLASFMSAITLLGVTSENYSYGTQFVLINVSYAIATPIAAYCYLPVFYRLSEYSVYQYLEYRFGRPTRIVCSVAFTTQMILYMGIVLYAPAVALNAVTGISLWLSVLLVGLVCTFYSTLGGMKAVLVTDVFQTLLMFAAIFSVIGVGCRLVGGPAQVWEIADQGERIQFFNLSPDPTERHTVWSLAVGGIFIYLSLYAVNQAQVQRLLSIGTLRQSQLSLWLQWPILTLLSCSTSFAGLVIYAYYRGCDPILEKRIFFKDQLLPRFVMDTMEDYPGLPGLFVAGIFSGSLSTVSSAVNSLAAVTIHDYVKSVLCWSGHSDDWELPLTKLLSLLYGLLCLGVAYVVSKVGASVLTASLTIFGAVGGPLLGVFTLGMFSTRANQTGALSGLLVALIFGLGVGFAPKPTPVTLPLSSGLCGRNATHVPGIVVAESELADTPLEAINNTVAVVAVSSPQVDSESPEDYFYLVRISYMWFSMLGFLIVLVVGRLASLVRPAPVVDPDLLSPLREWFRRRYSMQAPTSPSRQKLNGGGQILDMEEFEAKTRL